MKPPRTILMSIAAVFTVGVLAAGAQMMGGGQGAGHQHGAMQGAMSSDQMMRGIDSMHEWRHGHDARLHIHACGTFGPQHGSHDVIDAGAPRSDAPGSRRHG